MKLNIFSAMLRGPRTRQEDCIVDGAGVYQADHLEKKREMRDERILLAVCDGMGGHADGDAASRFVCDRLLQESLDGTLAPDSVEDVLIRIQESAKQHLQENSGTTVAGLIATGDQAAVFNAGDSRVYKIADDGLQYVSHDHSLVQGLVDRAFIRQDIAPLHPLKSIIEFGVGPAFADAWQGSTIHIHNASVSKGDCYLLCSDGLTDLMTEQELFNCLSSHSKDKGTALLGLVQSRGPIDNTSFIIVEFC